MRRRLLGVRHKSIKGSTRLLLSYLYTYTLYTQCLSIRDWLLNLVTALVTGRWGGKKGRGQTHAKRREYRERGRDSAKEESETSRMSGTISEKQRLAQTRGELRRLARKPSHGC